MRRKMTSKKKNKEKQIGEKTLKLNDLNDFTVGEIVEKSKRISKNNDENETVLDKYIRQHRGEIEEAKGKELDQFVKVERANLKEAKAKSSDERFNGRVNEKNGEKKAVDFEPVRADKKAKVEIEETKKADEVAEMPEPEAVSEVSTVGAAAKEKQTDKTIAREDKGPIFDTVTVVGEPAKADKPAVTKLEDKATKTAEATVGSVPFGSQTPESQEATSKVELPKTDVSEDLMPELTETKPETETAVESETEIEATPLKTEEAKVTAIPVPVQAKRSAKAEREISAAPVSEPVSSPVSTDESDDAPTKSKRTPTIIGVCALILIAAGGIYFATQNANQKSQTVQTSSSSSAAKTDDQAQFDKDYQNFFVDSAQTQLRNSQFSKTATLKADVKAITNADEKIKANNKYTKLLAQIDAIKAVNALFETDIITDGTLGKATLKSGVTIPAVPKTSNSKLNSLLQQAIDEAKSQEASSKTATAQSSANATATSQSSAAKSKTTTSASSATSQSSTTQAATTSDGLSATGVTLQVSKSRVAPQANLNVNDPAFTWAAGIKETVLNKCRTRGYISGNNYIMVPVAIHTTNGNGSPAGIVSGYYNLYAPDGRYLVTINCKTGYFFGNGSNHQLDFSE